MPARGNKENKCDRCKIYKPLCLCLLTPNIELTTRIVVVMHWRESNLPTNTGSLACMALPNSEIKIRGFRDELLQGFYPKESTPLLLFPTDDALELTPALVKDLKRPLTLIVPDGSWRQAKKVSGREEGLKGVMKVKLPPGAPSEYRLRHSPHEENLSTFEAIARALGIIEGPEMGPIIQAKLELLFLTMVERRLWGSGKLLAKDCITQIPEEAFEAMRRAGIRGSAEYGSLRRRL